MSIVWYKQAEAELGQAQLKLRLNFTKLDLKWLRYDQNIDIIASHSISGRLAGG